MDKKLKLGIDLDDTVWVASKTLLNLYNLKNGTDYKFNDCNVYPVMKFLNINKEETRELVRNHEYELDLLDGFLEVFDKIKDKFDIFFITARSNQNKPFILKQMDKIFEDWDERETPIYCCADKESKTFTSKKDICEELGIDIMIDDVLRHLDGCAKDGVKCLLLDYPWNRVEILDENIIRVNNWQEIFYELNKIIGTNDSNN